MNDYIHRVLDAGNVRCALAAGNDLQCWSKHISNNGGIYILYSAKYISDTEYYVDNTTFTVCRGILTAGSGAASQAAPINHGRIRQQTSLVSWPRPTTRLCPRRCEHQPAQAQLLATVKPLHPFCCVCLMLSYPVACRQVLYWRCVKFRCTNHFGTICLA